MLPPQKRELDSDSEDDPDYVPPADDPESDHDTEARDYVGANPEVRQADAAEKKSAREALWADFKASVSTPPSTCASVPHTKTVKVEKRYRFAGEDVTEVVEVPEDSEDAKRWPRWQPPHAEGAQAAPAGTAPANDAASAGEASSSAAAPEPHAAAAPAPPKPAKRPGPRKSKTLLAPLPGAQKAKKLTTLDKSALDWRAHVEGAPPDTGLRDELDAHRRGGGYLEKVEFLKRVEQRKEEALEASRATKRRKTIT